MKKLFTLVAMLPLAMGAFADDTSYIVDDTEETTVGAEDLSTGWWGDFSSAYYLTQGNTLTLNFTNYTDGEMYYHNFAIVVTSNEAEADRYNDGSTYEEYGVLRADGAGWGTGFDSNDLFVEGIDTATIGTDMNGAEVEVKVAFEGTTATITTISTTTEGNKLYQQIPVDVTDDTLRVFVTVENAYLDNFSSSYAEGVDTEIEDLEYKDYVVNGYEETMVGSSSCGTTFFTEFSSYYQIPTDATLSLSLTNYTIGTYNYQNFYVLVTNDYGRSDSGYSEYLCLRSDALGWGNSYFADSLVTSGFDWDTFTTDMNGATVDITIENAGTTAYVTTVATSEDGDAVMTQYLPIAIDEGTIRAFLTVEGGYLRNITSSLETADEETEENDDVETGIEAVETADDANDDVYYNLSGQKVGDNYKGIVIKNGKKCILK